MTKRVLTILVSLCVWTADWLYRRYQQMLGRDHPGTCVVLCYHGILPEERNRFEKQMEALVRYAKPVSVHNRRILEKGKHHVAVTFDDGLTSVAENAIPVLRELNIPSAIFIPTGYFGKKCKWMRSEEELMREEGKRISKRDRKQFLFDQVMDEQQIRNLICNLVSIESHGISHRDLVSISEDAARGELMHSKNEIEKKLGEGVQCFSFPRGKYNDRILELAKEAKYERVFSISPTLAFSNPEEFMTGRVVVEPADWMLEFQLKMLGAYRWLAKLPHKEWGKRCEGLIKGRSMGINPNGNLG